MLRVNNLIGFGAGGGGPVVSLVYTGGGTGANFGAEHADRTLIVVVLGRTNETTFEELISLTIGGVSATEHRNENAANVGGYNNPVVAAIYSAAVPTGTSGNIVPTSSFASGFNYQYAVIRVIGAVAGVTSAGDADHDESNLALNLNTTAGNLLVVGGCWHTSTTITPTGVDTDALNSDGRYAGYAYKTTTETPRTVQLNASGSNDSAGAAVQFSITPP